MEILRTSCIVSSTCGFTLCVVFLFTRMPGVLASFSVLSLGLLAVAAVFLEFRWTHVATLRTFANIVQVAELLAIKAFFFVAQRTGIRDQTHASLVRVLPTSARVDRFRRIIVWRVRRCTCWLDLLICSLAIWVNPRSAA